MQETNLEDGSSVGQRQDTSTDEELYTREKANSCGEFGFALALLFSFFSDTLPARRTQSRKRLRHRPQNRHLKLNTGVQSQHFAQRGEVTRCHLRRGLHTSTGARMVSQPLLSLCPMAPNKDSQGRACASRATRASVLTLREPQ